MKHIIALSFFIGLLILVGCADKPSPCEQFRTGNFKAMKPELDAWIVTRVGTRQVDVNNIDGVTVVSHVEWQSDCSFVLTYEEAFPEVVSEGLVGKKMQVDIVEVKNRAYVCQIQIDSIVDRIEMVRLN